jgi:hypothetical protein
MRTEIIRKKVAEVLESLKILRDNLLKALRSLSRSGWLDGM